MAPEFSLPAIPTILAMVGGVKCCSTIDHAVGFHQISMAKEDRLKIAFLSVTGPFEYKAIPFGLKGAPAAFHANINAYLQPLLGQGVIAYPNDLLACTPDLPSQATLLRQLLSTFLKHQFFPKFGKYKLTKRKLTYLI